MSCCIVLASVIRRLWRASRGTQPSTVRLSSSARGTPSSSPLAADADSQ